ncbi:hypothetical protein N7490_000090 [Penicillium lividum]|nr:hypothetical protein N7490_000090 [Penicillium lividum]
MNDESSSIKHRRANNPGGYMALLEIFVQRKGRVLRKIISASEALDTIHDKCVYYEMQMQAILKGMFAVMTNGHRQRVQEYDAVHRPGTQAELTRRELKTRVTPSVDFNLRSVDWIP